MLIYVYTYIRVYRKINQSIIFSKNFYENDDLEFKKLAQEYGLPIKKSVEVAPVSTENPSLLTSLLPEIIGKRHS